MFPVSTPLPHWDKNELKFHLEISTAAPPAQGNWLQVTRESKGQHSKFQAKFTSVPDWDEKTEGTHGALLFHIQPNIAGRHGDGSMESWDRQKGGQILGPGSPEGRQLMQTAWNAARFQNDPPPPTHPPTTVPDSLPLPPSLYHTSAFHHCFLSVSCTPHFYFLCFIVHFYFLSLPNLTFLPTLQLLRHDSVPAQAQSMPPCNL